MVYSDDKFCRRCGAETNRTTLHDPLAAPLHCPRCRTALARVKVGTTDLSECPACDGLWVESGAFEKICANQEQQSIGIAPGAAPWPAQPVTAVRYIPCPVCAKLMNRVNFAACSGVIVDICRSHGTWFDAEELARIVSFIRAGGMEASRERKKAELADEERRIRQLRKAAAPRHGEEDPEFQRRAIFATRDLLRLLERRG
jgi:Zn-finger nucleic acid-binding protein